MFGDKTVNEEDQKRDREEFFRKILPRLDKQLQGKEFMCGEDITVVDLQYYNEISTVVNLTKVELGEDDYPNLAKWYN